MSRQRTMNDVGRSEMRGKLAASTTFDIFRFVKRKNAVGGNHQSELGRAVRDLMLRRGELRAVFLSEHTFSGLLGSNSG